LISCTSELGMKRRSSASSAARVTAAAAGLLPVAFLQLLPDFVQVEARRLLPLRVVLERHQELAYESLGGHEYERMVHDPVVVGVRGDVRPLVRISPEVEELREA